MNKIRAVVASLLMVVAVVTCVRDKSLVTKMTRSRVQHMESLSGYRNGVYVPLERSKIGGRVAVLIPVTGDNLNLLISRWTHFSKDARNLVLPVLICIQKVCPLVLNEEASSQDVAVLDHTSYSTAISIASAAASNQVVIVGPNNNVLDVVEEPINDGDFAAFAKRVKVLTSA